MKCAVAKLYVRRVPATVVEVCGALNCMTLEHTIVDGDMIPRALFSRVSSLLSYDVFMFHFVLLCRYVCFRFFVCMYMK